MGAATVNIPIDNCFSLRRFSVNPFSLSTLIDFIILTLGLFMRNNEDPKSLDTGRLPQMTTSLLPTLRNISGRVMAAETRGGMGRRGRGAWWTGEGRTVGANGSTLFMFQPGIKRGTEGRTWINISCYLVREQDKPVDKSNVFQINFGEMSFENEMNWIERNFFMMKDRNFSCFSQKHRRYNKY